MEWGLILLGVWIALVAFLLGQVVRQRVGAWRRGRVARRRVELEAQVAVAAQRELHEAQHAIMALQLAGREARQRIIREALRYRRGRDEDGPPLEPL